MHGAPDPDRGVGRHECDEEGGDAHAQQGGDQCCLAPDAIAVMAEYRCADRPADEADEISAERRQCRRERVFVRKIKLAEDQSGGRAVNEKVIPFDRCADCRRDDCLAQLSAVFGSGKISINGCHGHRQPPMPCMAAPREQEFGHMLPTR